MYSCVKHPIRIAIGLFIFGVLTVALLTHSSVSNTTAPVGLSGSAANRFTIWDAAKPNLLARNGQPITSSYYEQRDWNPHVQLQDYPRLLQQSMTLAEDQRFWQHNGNDWLARLNATWQTLRALRPVRGASTISEQLVRIYRNANSQGLTPTYVGRFWQRWLDGVAAYRLEKQLSKAQILALYLANIPYASERRGVAQAARLYFNRSLETLTPNEFLVLSVLPRSPSGLDPRFGADQRKALMQRVDWLRERLAASGKLLSPNAEIAFANSELDFNAPHFARWVYQLLSRERHELNQTAARSGAQLPEEVRTTLDPSLQKLSQLTLSAQLEQLAGRSVANAAALIVDHQNDHILVWASASSENSNSEHIDPVLTKRQPGSTLKPFLYALALENGWTAATLIEDQPLEQRVGQGIHSYRNYSGKFYGKIRLRQALANSLNIPAVHALEFVGPSTALERLRRSGLISLTQTADFYGGGLALGAGEVSLLELVTAYASLARRGLMRPLTAFTDTQDAAAAKPLLAWDRRASEIITDILTDAEARRLEFGDSPISRDFAFKTGTSSGHRDAWTVAYNQRYVIGVWLGNVDGRPMSGVTGGNAALPIAASLGSLLPNRHANNAALANEIPTHSVGTASLPLLQRRICKASGQLATHFCPSLTEIFRADHAPTAQCQLHIATDNRRQQQPENLLSSAKVEIIAPKPGTVIALDPRIAASLQRYVFKINSLRNKQRVRWKLNGKVIATTDTTELPWKPISGKHKLEAEILSSTQKIIDFSMVTFVAH